MEMSDQSGEKSKMNLADHIGTPEHLREVQESIEVAKKKIRGELLSREYVDYEGYPLAELTKSVRAIVSEATGADTEDLAIEEPPPHISGDFAVSFFDIAKKNRENPVELAKKAADRIKEGDHRFVEKGETVGPFLNIELEKAIIIKEVVSQVLELKDKYGYSNINQGEISVIDFSAPNIAKPFGVQHLRSTIIGQSLSRIYEATGFTVIRDNHLGDWGTQFGKLTYAFEEWGKDLDLEECDDPIEELNKLYIRFGKEAEERPEILNEARRRFAKLEEGDMKYLELWDTFREVSMRGFQKTYDVLGIDFDTEIGESYFVRDAKRITQEIIDSEIADIDESGAVVVDFKKTDEENDIPSFLIQKADGSTIYISRDLATIKFRKDEFNPSAIVYVVGGEQSLNFRQVFELSKRMGYSEGVDTVHVGFGMILVDGKKMSTRRGTLIALDELISQSINKSKEIIKEKNPSLSDEEADDIATKIGLGAIYYNDLSQSRIKDISFDWDKMLNFDEGSAAYIQYTYVRINSIMEKLGDSIDLDNFDFDKLSFEDESEFEIVKKMMLFPDIVKKSREKNSPHYIATYLEDLCKTFNTFYNKVSIMKTEDADLKSSRAALSKAASQVINNGLYLLNISTVGKM